jgi:hypothetical protein
MACPGMPNLAMEVPYSTSLPAATGTLVHSMTEMLLKDRLENVTLQDYWLGRKENVEDFEIEVDEDMIKCAEVYVDYVNRRKEELDAKMLIEERVSMEEISEHIWGTADAILIGEKELEIIDLKSGKFPVDVENNTQLLIYALGALSRYGNEDTVVTMTIVQPRSWHKDGAIRSYSMSAANLVEWGYETLKPAADACDEEEPQYNPSKENCRFCNAKDICDSYKQYMEEKK